MIHLDLPPAPARTAGVRLIGMPALYGGEVIERFGEAGRTVAELVDVALGMRVYPAMATSVRVSIGDMIVPREHWHRVRPKPDAVVMVRVVPQNGDFLKIVLTLAIVVSAAYLGPLAAGAYLGTTAAAATAAGTAASFAATSAIATGIIGIGGTLLLNALIPPRSPTLGGSAPSPTYSIGGTRNTGGAWAYIPSVLGRHRMAPIYLARPYTEVRGSDQYLRVKFLWGYGPLRIEDMRIGETLIADFDDIEVETREGLPDDPPTTLYPSQVFEESLSIYLASGADPSVRRTEADTEEISIDLSFPRGLIDYSKTSSKKKEITSTVRIEMRKVGDVAWTLVTDLATTEKRQEPFRRGYRWVVPKAQYDVRLQRTDEEAATGTDRTEWTVLRSMRIGAPYTFRKPLATTDILIKAQDQLQGVIDTLTGIANSRCPDWDSATGTWIVRETSRPASLYRYALQGPACSRPRTDAQINLPVLQDWHEHCVALGLEFNQVRDFEATLPSTLGDIAAAGHASWAMPDGRWSVVIDRPQTEIRQHFTARNSWGFTTEWASGEVPHAYRCRFVDRDADWDVNAERIVYDEGYSEANATLYQEIQFPGVTDAGRVWKEAKKAFVTLRTQFLAHSTNVDWEYLTARRGNLTVGAHPVLGVGLVQGLVKSVSTTGTLTTVVLDDEVTMVAGRSYVLRCREGDTGASVLRPVVTIPGTTTAVRLGGIGPLPEPGDLFLFGEADKEVRRLIVKGIEPQEKLTARVTMIDEAPERHAVEALTPPPWVPRQPQRDQDVPAVPTIIAVSSGDAAQTIGEDGTILAPVTVGIAPGGGGRVAAAMFVVFHRPFGSTAPWLTASAAAAQGSVRILGYEPGETIELQVQAVSSAGKSSRRSTPPVTHTVAARTHRPPDPATFAVVRLANGLRQFSWTAADPDGSGMPADLAGVEIRYRTGTNPLWTFADLNPLFSGPRPNSPWETPEPGPGGTYTFGLVYKNWSGLVSAVPKLITATLGPGVTVPAPRVDTLPGPIGNTNPLIFGTAGSAEPLAAIKVFVDGTQMGTTTADAAGAWSVQLAGLAAGPRIIIATQTAAGANSGPSNPIVLVVQWNDPDASGHVDFKNSRGWLLGAAANPTAIFNTVVTSPQISTNADGSLRSILANDLPVCDRGLELWESRTNRCTNRNAAPIDLTGVTASGAGTAGGVTVVDDSATMVGASILAALKMSGLLTGFVYKLDNSTGVADATATISGPVSATGACNASVVYRGSAGRVEVGGVAVVSFGASTPYVRVNGQRTAAATSEQMRIVAPAGAVIWFILNQLENSTTYCSAPIVVNAALATRAAPVITRTLSTDFDGTQGFVGFRGSVASGVISNGVPLRFETPDATHSHALQATTSVGILGGTTNVTSQAAPLKTIGMTTTRTVVYGWAANDFALAVDGTAPVTDASGTVPSTSAPVLKLVPTGFSGIIEQIKWAPVKPANAAIQSKSGWATL
jgi:hypothetical protein